MINPFNSNNDQFLFRKNYQLIHKSPPPTATTTSPTDYSLSRLQTKNPFNSHSPQISFRNSVVSPDRGNSLSRSKAGSSMQQYAPKGGILQSADGWKREIQNSERKKLQVYGVEGLRYNAFPAPEDPLRMSSERDDYYKVVKHSEIKMPSTNRFDKYDSASNYYLSPRDNLLPVKPRRQMFEDQIEQSPNFNLIDPRIPDANSAHSGRSNDSKHSRGHQSKLNDSKVNDMFESHFEDRFKRSMNYGSYYGGGGGAPHESMIESKKRGNKFRQNNTHPPANVVGVARISSMESSVHKLDVTPNCISIGGVLYHRIPL